MSSLIPPRPPSRRNRPLLWCALMALGLGLRMALAIFVPKIFHPDALFQVMEPAHRLAFGYGATTWEWREGIRSWVLPAFVALILRTTAWMGPGSSGYLTATNVVFSLISLTTVWFGYAWARKVAGLNAAWIAAGLCCFHYWLVFFATQTFSEVMAAHLLLPGLYLGMQAEAPSEKKWIFLAALLCGIAVGLRMQLLPALLAACVWFCYPRWRQRIPAAAGGFFLALSAFGLADLFTGSYPFQSYFRYFRINLIEHKAEHYGAFPWYYYGIVLFFFLGPALLLLWQGARRSPFLAAIAAILVVSHSFLAHKEIRFIYPALPLLLTLAALGAADYAALLGARIRLLASPRALIALCLTGFALNSLMIGYTANKRMQLSVYSTWIRPAYFQLSQDSSLCGLGYYQTGWDYSGGPSYLHRDIPILPLNRKPDYDRLSPSFNEFFARQDFREIPADYRRVQCWQGICLYRRPGGCTAPAESDTLNGYLRRYGK